MLAVLLALAFAFRLALAFPVQGRELCTNALGGATSERVGSELVDGLPEWRVPLLLLVAASLMAAFACLGGGRWA